jgi:hypothetical protein
LVRPASPVGPCDRSLAERLVAQSNPDLLDLVEVDLVAGAVIELGRLGRLAVGDGLGVLDGAAAFQVGGDAGGPEGVAADD